MPKKNYTKGKAQNAVVAMQRKLRKLHEDGYVSAQKYVSMSQDFARMIKSIK